MKKVLVVIGIVLAMSLTCQVAGAASIQAGIGTCEPGMTGLAVPVTLTADAGEQIASVQFDMTFDADVFEVTDVSAGAAAVAADKQLSYSEWSPGRIRVVILGLNENTIASGAVADAQLNVSDSASGGAYEVGISDVLLADPDGTSVPAQENGGQIVVVGPVLEGTPDGLNSPFSVFFGVRGGRRSRILGVQKKSGPPRLNCSNRKWIVQ